LNSLLTVGNTDNPDQGSEYEKHKQDQLQKQKEGKGHWKPELASDSEEAVCHIPLNLGVKKNWRLDH